MRYKGRLVGVVMAALVIAGSGSVSAQTPQDRTGWRLSFGGSAYRIDELVGTPVTPSGTVSRTIGRRGFIGLEVNGIFNKGFYSASALTGDLDIGVRFPVDRFEFTLSGGPSGIFGGGDSDGTPYMGGGVQAAAGATAWLSDHVGLTGKVRARRWWGIVNDPRVGVSFGVVLRL